MAAFKPSLPYNVPFKLERPVKTSSQGKTIVKGEPVDDNFRYCSFKTNAGTETQKNGVVIIEDTAVVETYWDSEIVHLGFITLDDGSKYQIISKPENIERKNHFMKFKVKGV